MVKTANTRQSDDFRAMRGPRFYGSADRSILQRRVDSFRVVVIDVFAEQPS
jgi:hypothetical protein